VLLLTTTTRPKNKINYTNPNIMRHDDVELGRRRQTVGIRTRRFEHEIVSCCVFETSQTERRNSYTAASNSSKSTRVRQLFERSSANRFRT